MIPIENRPQEFCKIVSQYTGEQIDKVGQIEYWKMHGTKLFDFCEFYFFKMYSKSLSDQIRTRDDNIFRLKMIIGFLTIIIVVLILK